MGILSWLRRRNRTATETPLGVLEYRNANWCGQVTIAGEPERVDVFVSDLAGHPSAAEIESTQRLLRDLRSLDEAVGAALLAQSEVHLKTIGEFAGPAFPRPTTPAEAITVFQLASVRINDEGEPVLLYFYRDTDDDAMIELTVRANGVVGEHVGD